MEHVEKEHTDVPAADQARASVQELSSAINPDTVRAELEAILASAAFAGATRLQRFLRFIVEESLAGRSERLKEYLVGVEVFDRPISFEPQSDSVVRVEARRLRARLEGYYGTEGSNASVAIEMPKGGYRPTFRGNSLSAEGSAAGNGQGEAGNHAAGSVSVHRPALQPVPMEPNAAGRRRTPGTDLRSRWQASRFRWVVLALLVLSLAALALSFRRAYTVSPRPPFSSIAVLPLHSDGNSSDLEFLSQGLPEMIGDSLSSTSNLEVIAHDSAARFKGDSPADLAARLHVDSVLSGSAATNGKYVMVNLSLADASGRRLWSGTYQLANDEILNARYQITRDVIRALGLKERERAIGAAPAGISPRAERSYLIGRYYWNKRDAESLRRSVGLFDDAIAADPTFAPAHAALADAYAVMAMNDQTDPLDGILKARQSAQQALSLDENLAEAHAVLAWIHFFYDWKWENAESEFRRALELNPNYATAHQWYGLTLIARGRFDDAIRQFRTASELDPLSSIAQTDVGVAEYYARRYPFALRDAEAASAADPSFFWNHALIGAIETEQGKMTDAIAALERAHRLGGDDLDCRMRLAVAYFRAGQNLRARSLLKQLLPEVEHSHRGRYQLACVYAAFGDKRQAIDWLRRSMANHESGVAFFFVDPLMDDLRADPQSASLRSTLNPAE
jgi:Tfp pilus assembly protein PilF/TolB-like protein